MNREWRPTSCRAVRHQQDHAELVGHRKTRGEPLRLTTGPVQ